MSDYLNYLMQHQKKSQETDYPCPEDKSKRTVYINLCE